MPADVLILRDDLDTDPRVQRLAEVLDCEVDLVIAKLWRLWRYARRLGRGGFMEAETPATLDCGVVYCQGFGEALIRVGWLKQLTHGLQIPNWDEWCSPEAVRQLLRRAAEPDDFPGFDAFWGAYPRKEGKQAARKVWNRLRPSADLLASLLHGLARWVASEQWRRGVIPHASTWLNNWRWEDEIHDGRGSLGQPGRVGAPAGKYDHLRNGGPEA